MPVSESDCLSPADRPFSASLAMGHAPQSLHSLSSVLDDALSREDEDTLLRVLSLLTSRFYQQRSHEEQPEAAAKEEIQNTKAKEEEEATAKEEESGVKYWKQFYQKCKDCYNYEGMWVGMYGSHGKELIKVSSILFQTFLLGQ